MINYESNQISQVLDSMTPEDDGILRLKIESNDGQTNWLNISREQAGMVIDVFEGETIGDKIADYNYKMLAEFDVAASESTDLFTWIKCELAKQSAIKDKIIRILRKNVLATKPTSDSPSLGLASYSAAYNRTVGITSEIADALGYDRLQFMRECLID